MGESYMKSKRIYEIEAFIKNNKTASIEELVETFNVSTNTIRRDINQLVDMNVVKKVYGGIELIEENHRTVDYYQRNSKNYKSKSILVSLLLKKLKPMTLSILIQVLQRYIS